MPSLKINDSKLVEALVKHGNVAKAAAALGVGKSTVYKRLQNEEVRRMLDAAQGVMLDAAATAMTDGLSEAVEALLSVIRDSSAAATVRVSAADALLRHCNRYIESANVMRRLDALEQAQEQAS